MGNCASDEATQASKAIDQQNRKDFKKSARVAKLLLLGTGESGKSTILKQMKIIVNANKNIEGLTDDEKKAQISIIRNNVLDSIEVLLEAADKFACTYEDKEAMAARARVLGALQADGSHRDYSAQLAADVTLLWKHATTQEILKRKDEFQFLDSAPYFLNKAEKLVGEDYLPSDDDVLRARSMTTGIVTFPFEVNNKNGGTFQFELIDVGGQRTERRKWIHCFEDVTAVLFIISLSDYNQTLYEDENTNRMHESEKVFGQMLNNFFFKNTPFIVFFNKVDLFREKLKVAPITIAYPEYTGKQEEAEALNFIRGRFLMQNASTSKDREIYDYLTTATDTTLVKNLFATIQDIILRKLLDQAGF